MASKGRPANGPKIPITIIFSTSKNKNAKVKCKTIKNRSMDDLIECNYVIPGIPEKAVIHHVLVGSAPEFLNRYMPKYGLPLVTK